MSLITYLTRIHFADNVLEDALPEEMARLRTRHPLMLLDHDAGCDATLGRLEGALPPNTPTTMLWLGAVEPARPEAALADHLARTGPDLIIGHGGATALSAARSLARQGGLPAIAIATTPAAIGVEPGAGVQMLALPEAVLCDPTLLAALSAARAAETGIDALSHAIEAFLANSDNPPADGMALEAIRQAVTVLERWYDAPGDPSACRAMMAVAINAGLAARKGLGAVEALARAIDAATGVPEHHGRWQAALMPPALAFNAPAIPSRLASLAAALGTSGADAVAARLRAIAARLGLPSSLRGLGLDEATKREIADLAVADPASRANPRHIGKEDYLGILEAAL
jgi:alcohol dehydrogenase class IV